MLAEISEGRTILMQMCTTRRAAVARTYSEVRTLHKTWTNSLTMLALMKRNLLVLNERERPATLPTLSYHPRQHTPYNASRMNQRSPDSSVFLLICMTVVCLLSVRTSMAQDIGTQYNALKALYATTDGDNWTNNSGWDTTLANPTVAELNDFFGVEVNASGLVTRIELVE